MTTAVLANRWHSLAPGAILALSLTAVPVGAQDEIGKLEASVHDSFGSPIAAVPLPSGPGAIGPAEPAR